MAGSIDYVLQPDGTYKWEVVEPKAKTSEVVKSTSAPKAKTTKKKTTKKKTDSPISE